ncbi:MAG: hypothetical protein AAF253_10630 [Pseudomonadota bacterium]
MAWKRWTVLGVVVVATVGCAAVGDFASDDPGLREAAGVFSSRFLAVSDADMTATAYADGQLEPFEGAGDELILIENGAVTATIAASNSVISWPQVVDATPDGRFAVVVETRGPAPAGLEAYDSVYTDFPVGETVSVYAVDEGALRLTDTVSGVGENMQSVDIAPNGQVVIATETPGAELVTAQISEAGEMVDVASHDLSPPYRDDDAERRIRTIHIASDGVTLAANVANRRVQFYRLSGDGVAPMGRPTEDLGSRLAVGKWTPDGEFFVVTDTNWADGTLHMLTQGPGALTAIRPPTTGAGAPLITGRVSVGRSPEGMGMSPDGTRIATINMERTYLPDLPFLAAWQGRREYSVSLVSIDPETGAMAELDRAYTAGILPEDVIFDAAGENLAVAVFHRRKGADRLRGFIDFYSIEGDTLARQDVTQPVMRGAHDLVRLP